MRRKDTAGKDLAPAQSGSSLSLVHPEGSQGEGVSLDEICPRDRVHIEQEFAPRPADSKYSLMSFAGERT